jgi:hypothetical protein
VPFGSSGVSYGFEYPECAPDRIEMPGWVPTDLPLPEGTYATAVDDLGPGYNAGFFVIPEGNTIQSFIQLVGNDWQEAGYRLGQGDSEAEEVEALFSKPPATGSFKVQTTPCTDPAYLVMYLIYSPSDPEANQ